MLDLPEKLLLRQGFLESLAADKRKALEVVPEGFLRAARHKKSVQYFQRTKDSGKNGIYLNAGRKELARALAQKEYDRRILDAADQEGKLLSPLLAFFESGRMVENQYEAFPELKKALINPIELSSEEYAAQWEAEPFTPKEWNSPAAGFLSEKNERMRSKSELLIAGMLLKRGIPYRYECPLQLGSVTIYPDFTILCKSSRKEIIWEHLGLLDDPDYLEKSIWKMAIYERNGYFLGDRLIITYETKRHPLDIKLVEEKMEQYCL